MCLRLKGRKSARMAGGGTNDFSDEFRRAYGFCPGSVLFSSVARKTRTTLTAERKGKRDQYPYGLQPALAKKAVL